MSKELEALQFIVNEALFSEFTKETNIKVRECNDIVRQALKRLEQIDNANPSEALKDLEKVKGYYIGGINSVEVYLEETKEFNTIKQALLKAQEQEKKIKDLELVFEKNVDVFRFKKLDFNTFNQLQKSCRLPELTEKEYDLLKELQKDDEHK